MCILLLKEDFYVVKKSIIQYISSIQPSIRHCSCFVSEKCCRGLLELILSAQTIGQFQGITQDR